MLKITVQGEETWSEELNEFVPGMKPTTLVLEHSLASLSKWESIHKKPFISSEKTKEETIDYIRCMTINTVPENIYNYLTPQQIQEITDYIVDTKTATWFTDDKAGLPNKTGRMNGEIVTSELIYFWMINASIPVEFEKWHLSRLLTLIKVIGEKNKPPKKMSKADLTRKYATLNAQRRAKLGTKG